MTMQLFSCSLFAFSASLDAFIVGITYGIRRVHITFWQNLLVSFITLIGTVLSLGFGYILVPLLSPTTATFAGSILLILLGMYYILKYIFSALKDSFLIKEPSLREMQKTSSDSQLPLHLKELLVLGIALSFNNMGIGVGASIAGLSPIPTALFTLIFSIVFLGLGNRLGKLRILGNAGPFADVLSGVLLVGLGSSMLLF